jgi:hypothetical protein
MHSRLITVGLVVVALAGAAHAQTVLYVDENAYIAPHDGSTWCTAFLTLDGALDGV